MLNATEKNQPELISNQQQKPRPFLFKDKDNREIVRYFLKPELDFWRKEYEIQPVLDPTKKIKSVDQFLNSAVACEICEDLPIPVIQKGTWRIEYRDSSFRIVCDKHVPEDSK